MQHIRLRGYTIKMRQPRPAQWLVIWIALFVGLLFGIVFQTGLLGFGVPVLVGVPLIWLLQRRSEKRKSDRQAR